MYWVVVKILGRKPRYWSMVDDNDLYLTWTLINKGGDDWVKFIIDIMIHYKDNQKRTLFFSLFFQTILELNIIVCKKEDLTESPKILDYGGIEKMRYYRDNNGDYYYLEESGQNFYEDKVVKPSKETPVETASSSSGFFPLT